MSSLPKGCSENERVVIFPCHSISDMDRFLFLVDPLTGELLQDMFVDKQFLRAGFPRRWWVYSRPASRTAPHLPSHPFTILSWSKRSRLHDQVRVAVRLDMQFMVQRVCASLFRSIGMTS